VSAQTSNLTEPDDARILREINERLAPMSAEARVDWALENLPGPHALSSSFGAQAAASLHLVAGRHPQVPVILIDTGYLFPETYQFIDRLSSCMAIDLRVYRATISIAWQEARHGKLWEQGVDGIQRYNAIRKVEPMQRALNELGVRTWFAGLRRSQASTRANVPLVELRDGRYKVHPIADWNDRQIFEYLQHHKLPYHPLWDKGYVSIGDTHTTRPLSADVSEAETRFFGLKSECGIHGLEG
jgi:phosphoadenosine phosphosulfate reductase